uniref:Uncharacterized protein n=1 Tax=Romanomermis culicivorax TaxID=13658 RepID=A0A915IAK4_ROMCU
MLAWDAKKFNNDGCMHTLRTNFYFTKALMMSQTEINISQIFRKLFRTHNFFSMNSMGFLDHHMASHIIACSSSGSNNRISADGGRINFFVENCHIFYNVYAISVIFNALLIFDIQFGKTFGTYKYLMVGHSKKSNNRQQKERGNVEERKQSHDYYSRKIEMVGESSWSKNVNS